MPQKLFVFGNALLSLPTKIKRKDLNLIATSGHACSCQKNAKADRISPFALPAIFSRAFLLQIICNYVLFIYF